MIATPLTPKARKALLLGSGELGKEVAIELMRLGVEVIACDKYPDAPAMQVAHRSYVFNMLDGETLRSVVEQERPDHIIPEIEAIATPVLVELEKEGFNVTPTARAAWLTMNREGIRRLAHEELGIPTSPYRFASTREEFDVAVKEIGIPCVVKPIMSSSGHGQSVIKSESDIDHAWKEAQKGDAPEPDVSLWKDSWISTMRSHCSQSEAYPAPTTASLWGTSRLTAITATHGSLSPCRRAPCRKRRKLPRKSLTHSEVTASSEWNYSSKATT